MVKVTRKIAICLILGLSLMPLCSSANNLTQLDIKKSTISPSTLNVTIYTNSPYDDNVAVTKKADNKYVILMPNLSGIGATNPDLSGLQDMVSNIDVKSIPDGENGYTKVTLTTTQPVTIRTTTKKSTPLTAEQKAYKNLIAQSRVNKTIKTANTSNSFEKPAVPKTTIKFSNPEPVKVSTSVKKEPETLLASKPIGFEVINKSENIVKAAQNKIKDTVQKKASDKQQDVPANLPVIDDIDKHVPAVSDIDLKINESEDLKPVENIEKVASSASSVTDEKDLSSNPFLVYCINLKNNIADKLLNRGIPAHMITTLAILLCSVLGLTLLFKLIKKSLEHSMALKESFKENLLSKPVQVKDYEEIVNDSALNWQEKYQKYIDNSKAKNTGRKILKHIGNGEYKFVNEVKKPSVKKAERVKQNTQTGYTEIFDDSIENGIQSAQLQPKKANRLKSYNKSSNNISPDNILPIKKVKNQDLKSVKTPKLYIVEDEAQLELDYKDLEESLEKTLHQSPSVEKLKFDEDIIFKQLEDSFTTAPVFSEGDQISHEMQKNKRKLKSFANKIALEETKRNVPLPKRRSEILRSRSSESKHVELSNPTLHSTFRKLDGGNLSVGDLIAKSDRVLNSPIAHNKPLANTAKQETYSTISVDEYFDKVDSSSSITASASLASRVADSLGKITEEINAKKLGQQLKKNPFDGMIVKSGYTIDDNSGFFVVTNSEGNTSLIGRINNDVTLIKDFGGESDVKLQVRVDNPNVYMVKANGYRYLVEVNNNKMGVLLEL